MLVSIGVLVALLSPIGAGAQSNLGKYFALTFPMDEDEHLTEPLEDSLLVFLFSPTATHATIQWGDSASARVLIPADSVIHFALSPTLLFDDNSTRVLKGKAIFITADDSIAVIGFEDPIDEAEVFGVIPISNW